MSHHGFCCGLSNHLCKLLAKGSSSDLNLATGPEILARELTFVKKKVKVFLFYLPAFGLISD